MTSGERARAKPIGPARSGTHANNETAPTALDVVKLMLDDPQIRLGLLDHPELQSPDGWLFLVGPKNQDVLFGPDPVFVEHLALRPPGRVGPGRPVEASVEAALEDLIRIASAAERSLDYEVAPYVPALQEWAEPLVAYKGAAERQKLPDTLRVILRIESDLERRRLNGDLTTLRFQDNVRFLDLAVAGLVRDVSEKQIKTRTDEVRSAIQHRPEMVVELLDAEAVVRNGADVPTDLGANLVGESIVRLCDLKALNRNELPWDVRKALIPARHATRERLAAIQKVKGIDHLAHALDQLADIRLNKVGSGSAATVHAAVRAIEEADPDEIGALLGLEARTSGRTRKPTLKVEELEQMENHEIADFLRRDSGPANDDPKHVVARDLKSSIERFPLVAQAVSASLMGPLTPARAL